MPIPQRDPHSTIRHLLASIEHLAKAVRENMPLPEEEDLSSEPFVPTQFQQDVLNALEGKSLRTDAITEKLACSNGQLFRKPKGGIAELQEHELVDKHKRLGYFRPDAPPPELENLNQVSPES